MHGHLGGLPPSLDLAHEKRLAGLLVRAARRGLLSSAHDLADGGLAQALVESALRRGIGATVSLGEDDPFVALFSESTGRVLVSLPASRSAELWSWRPRRASPSAGSASPAAMPWPSTVSSP